MSNYYANKRYRDRRLLAREIIKSCLSIYTIVIHCSITTLLEGVEETPFERKKEGDRVFYHAYRTLFFSFSNHVPILTKIYNSPSSEMAYLERILYTLLVNNFCNAFEEIETSFHFSCNASQRNIFNILDVKLEKHT